MPMQREEMEGANLREGIVEVAFEQWTEHIGRQTGISRLQRFPALQGDGIGQKSCTGRVQRTFSEFRW